MESMGGDFPSLSMNGTCITVVARKEEHPACTFGAH